MKKLSVLIILSFLSACVSLPDVYLIDRHTVMEIEASGEWPELDALFRAQALKKGPTTLAADPSNRRREKAFRVLNGEVYNPDSNKDKTLVGETSPEETLRGESL